MPSKKFTFKPIKEKPDITLVSDEDWIKAMEHLNLLRKKALDFAGLPGKNPFIWIGEHLTPLLKRFNDGERTKELYSLIMNQQEYA